MTKNNDTTHDLQIFIGRIPGEQPDSYEGIPTLIVAEGPSTVTRDFADSSPATQEQAHLSTYIIVANSEVVEVAHFPFPSKAVIRMIRSLTANQTRLQECISFGARLFDFVFQRSIRDVLRRIQDKGGKLRITLATNSPELTYVPWELLCDTCPGELPSFLSYQKEIHLIRSLRVFNRSQFELNRLGSQDTIKVLLVTASPRRLGHIDTETEEKMLQFVLDSVHSVRVEFEKIHDATVQRLRDALLDFRPHIVHLASHGGFNDEDGLGFVALVSDDDPSSFDLVNSYRFATLIDEPKSVQLVFVNTCYGAFQGGLSAFSGIAQCLHAIGVSDVVALQFMIQDKTAHAIVLNFYRYLLCDGNTVEDCVTMVRRHLFMSGYIFPESFGLALYQMNSTLGLNIGEKEQPITPGSPIEFRKYTDLFNETVAKELMDKLLAEGTVKELKFGDFILTTKHFLDVTALFGSDYALAFRVLEEIVAAKVPIGIFISLLRLCVRLAAETVESNPVSTAFLLKSRSDAEDYQEKYKVVIDKPLDTDFLSAMVSIKQVVSTVIKVDGRDKAFLVTYDHEKDVVHWSVQTLKSDVIKLVTECFCIEPQWGLVAHNTRESGCAFIIPGGPWPSIKIVTGGWQIAEYRGGIWRQHANLKDVSEGFKALARKTKLNEEVVINVMHKCLRASELRRGLSIVIQRDDSILNRCLPGFHDVKRQADSFGIRDKLIFDISDGDFLNAVAGDNAVIISSDGNTLAYQAVLSVTDSTDVSPIAGTGSRHLSAQKITKETDAIAVIVSQDGPITIFLDGKPEGRFLL
jgi:DNA integrity scanning protein DisA with diadenylate cyclase activity